MRKTVAIKIIIVSIMVVLMMPVLKAQASLVTGMVWDIPTETTTWAARIKEWLMDTLPKRIVAEILRILADDVKRWAISGFNGEPFFVTDFRSVLWQASDRAVGELIDEIAGAPDDLFCPNIKEMLLGSFSGGLQFFPLRTSFTESNACALTQELGLTPEELAEAIESGNVPWDFNLYASLGSANIFGLYWKIQSELATRQAENIQADSLQLTVNKGFWDEKECLEWSQPMTTAEGVNVPKFCKRWLYKTPGQVIAEQLSDTLKTDREWLLTIDEWGELFDAFITGIVKKLTSGLGLTRKIVSSTDTSGSGFIEKYTSYRKEPKSFEEIRVKNKENIERAFQQIAAGRAGKVEKDVIGEFLIDTVETGVEDLFQAKTDKAINYDNISLSRHYNPDYDVCTYFQETLENVQTALKKYPLRVNVHWGSDYNLNMGHVIEALRESYSPLYKACINEIEVPGDENTNCEVQNAYWARDPEGNNPIPDGEVIQPNQKVYMVAETYCAPGQLIRLPWFFVPKNSKKREDAYFALRAREWKERPDDPSQGGYYKAVCDWTPNSEDNGTFYLAPVTMETLKPDGSVRLNGSDPEKKHDDNPSSSSCDFFSDRRGTDICKKWEGTEGIFVRGTNCYGTECTAATKVKVSKTEGTEACKIAFCSHSKDQLWTGEKSKKSFTQGQFEKVCGYFGLPVPEKPEEIECSEDELENTTTRILGSNFSECKDVTF